MKASRGATLLAATCLALSAAPAGAVDQLLPGVKLTLQDRAGRQRAVVVLKSRSSSRPRRGAAMIRRASGRASAS